MENNKEFLSIEELKATFFDEDALLTQPAPIYRLRSKGQRYYYDFDLAGEPRFFVSVTTMIKNTMPTSPHLIKWIADKGYEEAQEFAAERAEYGTFLHIQIGELLINGTYDLDKTKEKLKAYIEEEKLSSSLIEWEDDIKKDLLAFAQFKIDHEIKPLAVEIILSSPQDGYAGAIDLVCEMTIEEKGYFGEVYKSGVKKGEPKETKQQKRVRAIVDFKSGRKGFFPEHEIQLHAYQRMWETHFEQYPVEKLFNWSPKDWRGKEPTYNLKDQTGSKNALKLPYLTEIAAIEHEKRNTGIIIPTGVIEPKRGLENNIMSLTLAEIVKASKNRVDDPNDVPDVVPPEKGIDELAEEAHQERLKGGKNGQD